MTSRTVMRGRASERGEGTARLVIFLIILALVGYLAVQNMPIYFAVQTLKHDLAELARGSAAMRLPLDRVQRSAEKIADQNGFSADVVKVSALPNHGVLIRVDTVKQLDLLFTSYEWHIQDDIKGAGI